jgi:hypothetical protein
VYVRVRVSKISTPGQDTRVSVTALWNATSALEWSTPAQISAQISTQDRTHANKPRSGAKQIVVTTPQLSVLGPSRAGAQLSARHQPRRSVTPSNFFRRRRAAPARACSLSKTRPLCASDARLSCGRRRAGAGHAKIVITATPRENFSRWSYQCLTLPPSKAKPEGQGGLPV